MECGNWGEKGIVEVWKEITKDDVTWGSIGEHTIDINWVGDGYWGI